MIWILGGLAIINLVVIGWIALSRANEELRTVEDAVAGLLGEDRYVAASELWDILWFHDELLTPRRIDRVLWTTSVRRKQLGSKSEADRLSSNAQFVAREVDRHRQVFDSSEAFPLTTAQRRAVVHNEDAQLVLAGAGAGKTATVVAKVDYLVRSGLAEAPNIRVVAFNAKARDEVRDRLESRGLGGVTVQTFHGLGYSIVGERTGYKPPVSVLATDDQARTRALHEFLTSVMADPALESLVTLYLASYLRPIIVEDGNVTRAAVEQATKELPRTWSGDRVKSQGEWVLSNLLFRYGIDAEYEAPYEHRTSDGRRRQYQPDFRIAGTSIYIEYLGLARDGSTAPWVDQDDYHDALNWKREVHQANETTMIELSSYQLWEGTLADDLLQALQRHGVPTELRPVDDVLAAIEPIYVNQLTRLLDSFLQIFRAQGGSSADLCASLEELPATQRPRAEVFSRIFAAVLDRYEGRLTERGEIDFHGMITQATELLDSDGMGDSHVIVDEFQDISGSRMKLLQAVRGNRGRLVAVGDDWQSIYRFTGSDVSVVADVEDHVGHTVRTDIPDVFRFDQRLADMSKLFVMENPSQIDKEIRARTPKVSAGPVVTILPSRPNSPLDAVRSATARIASENPEASVLLLGRYRHTLNDLPPPRDPVFRGLKVELSTIHTSKGREADYVIIAAVDNGLYGFPSQIEDDPLLRLALPQAELTPHAKERRLFYVALTRARSGVVVLTDPANRSDFVSELESEHYSNWVHSELEAVHACTECGRDLVQRQAQSASFFGCTGYPDCTYTVPACDECHGFVSREPGSGSASCDECRKVFSGCRRCAHGFLVRRGGETNEFMGCSGWRPEPGGCTYTEAMLEDTP